MEEIQLPPLRSIDDFILASARFGMPDYQNKEKWNNRILQNLLYYQANYLVVALSAFCLVMYIRPLETSLGAIVVCGLLFAMFYASSHRATVQRFKQKYPALVIISVAVVATFVMYQIGSIAVFIFSIALPLLVILLHASLRMRNLRNKVLNKAEAIGFKKTPMGVLLKEFEFEIMSIF